ncbi:MAG: LTA synthase family protein [Cellulosilyticaceae bacterium]
MRQKIKLSLQVVAIIGGLTFLILLCGEGILRQDVWSVFRWIERHPIGFMMNYIVLFGLFMALACSFNRIGQSFLVVSLIYITVCIVSYYKYRLSGEYLIPSDLILMGEAASISKDMHLSLERHVVKGILFSLLLIVVAFRLDVFHLHKKYRFMSAVFFTVLCLGTAGVGAKVMNGKNGKGQGVSESVETVNKQYNENGFIIGFSQEIDEMIVKEPEGYDEKEVSQILSVYDGKTQKDMAVKPNIIMIMSESLFDVNRLQNITLSRNPLEQFQKAQNTHGKGNIVTAVYGGKTCQTEYEVLTGNSVEFTGVQNIAYMRFVTPQMASIPKLMKEEGYTTYGIHSYEGTFYSRNEAYKDLGIDTFYDMKTFTNPKLIRGYISDQDITDKIIQTYEDKGDNPMFCHVVTMQNHMPYEVGYEGEGVKVVAGEIGEKDKALLETYANGLAASDEALGRLLDYFEQVEEPTVIVMYGDHLPALGEKYDVYLKSKYIKGSFDKNDCFNLYQTPVLVWNNYGLPAKDFGYIDATYLGAKVLEYIGYRGDAYMQMLGEASQALPAYNETFVIDAQGFIKDGRVLSEEEAKWLRELRLVQYNRLFGQKESFFEEWKRE